LILRSFFNQIFREIRFFREKKIERILRNSFFLTKKKENNFRSKMNLAKFE